MVVVFVITFDISASDLESLQRAIVVSLPFILGDSAGEVLAIEYFIKVLFRYPPIK